MQLLTKVYDVSIGKLRCQLIKPLSDLGSALVAHHIHTIAKADQVRAYSIEEYAIGIGLLKQ